MHATFPLILLTLMLFISFLIDSCVCKEDETKANLYLPGGFVRPPHLHYASVAAKGTVDNILYQAPNRKSILVLFILFDTITTVHGLGIAITKVVSYVAFVSSTKCVCILLFRLDSGPAVALNVSVKLHSIFGSHWNIFWTLFIINPFQHTYNIFSIRK